MDVKEILKGLEDTTIQAAATEFASFLDLQKYMYKIPMMETTDLNSAMRKRF